MKSVRELLKEKPFCDRLIVAGKEEYNKYFDGESFTVVCDEKSRDRALKIKARSSGAESVIELSLSVGEYEKDLFLKEKNLLIVGDGELIKRVRSNTKTGVNRLIALLIDISIAECFKNEETVFGKDGKRREDLCELYKVLFDPKISFYSSRAYFAEAFSECAAAPAVVCEDELKRIAGLKGDKAVEYLYGATEHLLKANAENLFTSIVCAQIYLAKYYSERESMNGDLSSVAAILKKLGGENVSEAYFASAKAIVSVYRILTGNHLKNADVLPLYDERLNSINELFNGSELSFFSEYEPFSDEESVGVMEKLSNDPRALSATEEAAFQLAEFDRLYPLTYNGKKRRENYSERSLRFCVERGAYLSEGILKYYGDNGVLRALSE